MTGELSVSVLLVEDNPDHALLAKLMLGRLDEVREVRVVSDGVQALELLDRGPLPDLILLDLKLPDVDGFEVLEVLGRDAELKHIPVVVLSTSSVDSDRDKSAALGARAYFEKPLSGTDLKDFLLSHEDELDRQPLPF